MKRHILFRRIFSVVVITLVSVAFYCLGCGGGPSTSEDAALGEGAEENPPSVIEVIPPDHSSISKTKDIVVKFSKSMDPTTLVLDGAMAAQSDGGSWSASGTDNDTLTISPQAEWQLGIGELKIACNDLASNALPETKLGYAVHVVFVKAGETGDGMWDSPTGDINAAITQALAMFPIPSYVYVAQGTYEVLYGTSHIEMSEGVSLKGGFSAEDWTVRDHSTYITTIKDTSTSGGDEMNPNRAIGAGAGITAATVIDGFHLQGGGGDVPSAIFSHDNDGPTISNNVIYGGIGTKVSIGINNSSSSPRIHNNTIIGSDSGSKIGYGIFNIIDCSPEIYENTISGGTSADGSGGIISFFSSPRIYGNEIKGGAGDSTTGVVCLKGTGIIYNNIIDGGVGGNESIGVYAVNAPIKIYNNTIDGGMSIVGDSFGIMLDSDAQPSIINNIIFTSGGAKRYGIYEKDAGSDPLEVKNNDIFECQTALYYDHDTLLDLAWFGPCPNCCPTFSTGPHPACPNMLSSPASPNNIDNLSMNPVFESADDLHLTASSPTEVTEGGLDLSAYFQTDKGGNTRSVPWSMGAYEYIQQ